MGWYFSPQSRSELIAELIAPQETERVSAKVIAHTLRGNVLWSVVKLTAKVEGVHRDLTRWRCLNGALQARSEFARIFHRSRATNEYGIALVCPKIQVSNLDQRAGNAEAKLYRRN